jgi:hypothetical protein
MITGAQIRHARKLLGWERYKLAQRAKVHSSIIERAESVPGEPPVTDYQKAFIRDTLRAAGVEFTDGSEPGAHLSTTGTGRKRNDRFRDGNRGICRSLAGPR